MTDPRLDAYTDELLSIEVAFLKKEHPEKFGGDRYSDPNYAEWEAKVLAENQKLILDDKQRSAKIIETNLNLEDEEEWEQEPVEIDRDDPPIEE